KVALVEKSDFASGTSSRSTKLIHGGLRYLAQFHFRLTREALSERSVLQKLAPHLVEPIPFLFPIYHKRLEVWRVNTGLWLYDLLAGLRRTKLHRRLSRRDTLARVPQLNPDGLRASFVYYDARTDDARLVVEVLKAAVNHGAAIANYLNAERILTHDSRASGIIAHDLIRDELFEVRAHKVVVAAGVWLDRVLDGDQPTGQHRVRPAKGVHLIVPRDRLGGDLAIVFPTPDDRLMFVIPWQGATLIGTTDTDYQGPLDEPRADRSDVDYILNVVNAAFPNAKLTDADVISVQAGLRPLVASGDESTAKISREDRVFENRDGSIAIAGGKLTTYRQMGRKVVDLVVQRLREEGFLRRKLRSRTRDVPLSGFPERTRRRLGRLIRRRKVRLTPPDNVSLPWLRQETVQRLWRAYGANWQAVVETATEPSLAEPVLPGLDVLKAEIVFAARHEMACTLIDVLARRTHLALLDRDQARSAAPLVARLLARELGWNAEEEMRQLAHYYQQVEQFSIGAVR
ncbi:MAG TPA: glycerol-3-phosphate dehydrogenase/oxidase, partial [Chloroflexota bacterium]|nr:glycerol-3-phosphate dehydrogenase/oxidase [Chloroflexota bacterium]